MKKTYPDFRIKPIPFGILVYFIGLYDFKHHLFGNEITIGYFFSVVGVWILLPYLIRFRVKIKEEIDNNNAKFILSGILIVLLPLYTLIYWFIYG